MPAAVVSLQVFIEANREELLARTRRKVAERPSNHPAEADLPHGIPLFLSQLAASLSDEMARDPAQRAQASPPTNQNVAESAAIHGGKLLSMGYSIEEVVRNYGDVCQAVTELAVEANAPVTVAEFHTLNRCLDNAIAAAVTSWSGARELLHAKGTAKLAGLHGQATLAFELLATGRVAIRGPTGALLGRCLREMGELIMRGKARARKGLLDS
jgi:hypothetical protein